MRETGISCGIRHETDCRRCNSYKGKVGKAFENVIGGDFEADGPWEEMGADVTEFKQSLGKAGAVQGMSRKGGCIDNGATEQVLGHIKDEFSGGGHGAASKASRKTSTHMSSIGTPGGAVTNLRG